MTVYNSKREPFTGRDSDDGWTSHELGYTFNALDAYIFQGKKVHVCTQADYDKARQEKEKLSYLNDIGVLI